MNKEEREKVKLFWQLYFSAIITAGFVALIIEGAMMYNMLGNLNKLAGASFIIFLAGSCPIIVLYFVNAIGDAIGDNK